MKTKTMLVLGTDNTERLLKRLGIFKSLLLGKKDISSGREDMDIVSEVALSPSAIRAYLKDLHALGYVSKKRISAGSIPCGPSWPAHDEYDFTPAGLKYLEAELRVWSKTDKVEKKLLLEMQKLIPAYRKKQVKIQQLRNEMNKRYKKMGMNIRI